MNKFLKLIISCIALSVTLPAFAEIQISVPNNLNGEMQSIFCNYARPSAPHSYGLLNVVSPIQNGKLKLAPKTPDDFNTSATISARCSFHNSVKRRLSGTINFEVINSNARVTSASGSFQQK